MTDRDELLVKLRRVVSGSFSGSPEVKEFRRLSGGASQETWSLDAESNGTVTPLILRRAARRRVGSTAGFGLDTEAALVQVADQHGVPVPHVYRVLNADDDMGMGFIMNRIEGETIARKILRDAEFDAVRPKLARQCGEIAAKIHAIPVDALPALPQLSARDQLQQYRDMYDNFDYPHPVFEYAFRWLSDRVPSDTDPRCVHGDFRHGNFMICAKEGVVAALDWELAHTGDPMEDLGWMCVNSWRFGNIDQPVGGFGSYEELFSGYESVSGTPVDRERVKYWETFGSLKWGIMCMSMYFTFGSGMDRSIERAAIGRRSSEAEIDLMRLLTTSPGGD
jgi:aminoglycoside phosphotransferase (APT) family kinase protein